jgi:ribosomal protein S18 acetylase RimI-like enzyme
MIRRAKILEIPDILTITAACTVHMEARGIFQWNAAYPNKQVLEDDISRGELYVIRAGTRIAGCIAITHQMDKEYKDIKWRTPNGDNIYIHRLAVHPDFQGKGYARALMDHAEQLGREGGAISIRLDTFSRNPGNQHFYERRGYLRLGDVYFPKQSNHPFHCYELIL